jgi:ubiquinone/menaquinone biosynthesis C-methylase UbiE
MDDSNRIMVAAWNSVLYEKFCRFRHLIVEGLSQHSDAVFDRRGYSAGARVLDVGCGFGDSTMRLARCVGPSGEAVGLDCAENFVRAAEVAARDEQIKNARFIIGDAQADNLHGPYDHAFASFGTMFFTAPSAAMRNVRNALKPGATFTQIVWRKREDNPWLYEAELRVKEIVPVVSHDETDQVHCGPGPGRGGHIPRQVAGVGHGSPQDGAHSRQRAGEHPCADERGAGSGRFLPGLQTTHS